MNNEDFCRKLCEEFGLMDYSMAFNEMLPKRAVMSALSKAS